MDSKRWYPEGEFLASVLGFTNVDNAGVSGLELKYNDVLTRDVASATGLRPPINRWSVRLICGW